MKEKDIEKRNKISKEDIAKSYIDQDRGVYDIINDVKIAKQVEKGLSKDIVLEISKEKNEPKWMLDIRLKALEEFNKQSNPNWGPDLSEVDISKIVTYIKPDTKKTNNWNDVPEDIKDTFDKLGIPEAEKKALAGVSVQLDSEEVYHNVKELLKEQGIIYMDMSEALIKHEDLVKKYFTKAIPTTLHKYIALHYAVWSGGSFVYVPKGVKTTIPIQSYYRLNSSGAGQFEHTLIVVEDDASIHYIEGCSAPKYNELNVHAGAVEILVGDNAKMRFSTIENWSKNMYNLNTKRAIIGENSKMEWISGSFGSKVSMLYPTSILKGDGSSSEYTGITYASHGQNIDNGCTHIHLGKNTYSNINTKSITQGDGKSMTRNNIYISKNAIGAKTNSDCQSLMLDSGSVSDTIPVIDVNTDKADVGHEAKIGKIEDSAIFYLMSRGLTEADAKGMIVRGFAEPISKELPIEYALEMNRLIDIELEGANG